MEKKIVRQFILISLPLTRNSNVIKTKVVKIDEVTKLEKNDNEYYLYETIDGITTKEKISNIKHIFKFNNYTNFETKTKFNIPLTSILSAELNIIDSTIEVLFNNIEEANSFEIPDWFGPEILINFNKTKKKVK